MEIEDIDEVLVDFGTVYCGSKITRIVKIQNKSTIDQIFTAEKYSDRPRLDMGFIVKPPKSPSIRPNEEFTFTVEFVPKTVGIRCCDSYSVRHLYGVQCLIVTKAIVKGPKCSLSCTQLHLACPNDKKKFSKQFELKNEAGCNADFQFLVNENHPLILVQPHHGKVLASKSVHITVTYTPTDDQFYFKRIFCLVENQEPLILDVYGIWLKASENVKPEVEINFLPTYINGYHSFFYDEMNRMSKQELPFVSLDKSCIDFGHCQPKKTTNIEFSVANNCNHKLSVMWLQGMFTKDFKIEPTEIEIGANNCTTFIATFKPLARDRLYSTVLEAQVFSSDGLVPIPLEVNVKGDSFDELSCGWAAQYKVEPTSLVLPPCISSPFCPSHATLIIHRKGHLPLAYSFHSPPVTNFCVKPRHGVIQGNFQIVIVQYQPKNLCEAVDTEKWLLTFNSNENVNQCEVEFGCSIETPHIVVNHGKDLVFPPVHPGTEETLLINLYNPTRFSFWYNSEILGGDFEGVLTVPWAGELWPYEQCNIPLVFCPRGPGDLNIQISFSPSLDDGLAKKTTTGHVKASCHMTQLTVIPEKLLLKSVIRDFKHKREIEVTNSGDSVIGGSFSWVAGEGCNTGDLEITFLPETFYLRPGKSLNVQVRITPFEVGEKNACITFITNYLNDLTLLPVIIECVYPTLQITDLRVTNNAPLFTKIHYWKMMQINKFNTVMSNLRPKKTSEIDMNLPSYVRTNKPLLVELLVENDSELANHLTICPVVSCDCKPVKKQVSFSISKLDHNCPHKNQVELEPASVNVQAKSHVILKMKIFYKTVGHVENHFVLQFTPEDYEELRCSMKLRVNRTSIPKGIPFIDTTELKENGDFVFNMRPVYIGDIHAYAQGFLIYNNTKQDINFEVDDRLLHQTPFKYLRERKQIPSISNYHLLFTFLPYCCRTYEAEVTLTMNDKHQTIILRGIGVSSPQEGNKSKEYFPRKDKLNEISPPEVYFSTPHTNIGPIKPQSTMKDVFFINNNSKDIVSFRFLSAKHCAMVQLRVIPSKGLLQPGECIECHLKCHCYGWQSCLEITLACAYANFSQYAANIQSLNQFFEDLIMNQNYFTITERGSYNVGVTPPAEIWPVKNYLTMPVTIEVKDHSVTLDENILPVCPALIDHHKEDILELDEESKFLYTNVLERLLWKVIGETFQARNGCSEIFYEQIKDLGKTALQVPDHITQTVLEDVLHTTWQDVFQLNGYRSCELFRRNLIRQTMPDIKIPRNSSSGIPTVASISDSFNLSWSEGFQNSSKKSV